MGGGRRCMVVNCKSKRGDKNKKISLHEVPVDPKRRKLWFKMLKPYIDPLEHKEITYVCGKHFEQKYFMASKRKFLLRDAVPTIFDMDESTAQVDPLDDNVIENGTKKEEDDDDEEEKGEGGGEENTTISSTNDSETSQQTTNTSKYLFNSVKIYHENGRAEVCRVCFKEAYRHKKLTDSHCTRIETYKEMLEYLSFDINLDFYPEPVICLNCIMMLLNAYDFKKKCLKTETVLHQYQLSRISPEKPTNIIIIGKQKQSQSSSDEMTDSPKSDSPPSQTDSPPSQTDSPPSQTDPPPSQTDSPPSRTDAHRSRTAGRRSRPERSEPSGVLKAAKAPEIRGDPPYLCQECGRFFLNWRQCRRHLRLHRLKSETVESFSCEVCKQTLKNVNVAEHMDTHRRKKYKCVHCDRQFDRSNLLATHMKANHERSPYVTCDVCGKTCLRKMLTTHVAKHFDEKDAQCPVCGKLFYRWYLKQHVKTHSATLAKPKTAVSVCHVCGKFVSARLMNEHVRRHVEQPKFMCQVCTIAFRSDRELEIHKGRKLHLRNVMLDAVAKTQAQENS